MSGILFRMRIIPIRPQLLQLLRIKRITMSLDVTSSIAVWLAVLSGVVTILGTLYGLFLAVTQRRMDMNARLNDAALIAVRRSEAAVVRPLLRERLLAVVDATETTTNNTSMSSGIDSWQRRARTFAALQRSMSLTEVEKHMAHEYALNNLVSYLRRTPNPPLRVQTQSELNRHAVRLSELIENAYNLRPRLGTELIHALGEFARGVDVCQTAVPLPPPPPPPHHPFQTIQTRVNAYDVEDDVHLLSSSSHHLRCPSPFPPSPSLFIPSPEPSMVETATDLTIGYDKSR
jgi:hypothetical protein